MDHSKYLTLLRETVKEALDISGGNAGDAADYLLSKKKPFMFSRHYEEKKLALTRAKKVFDSERDRPVWFILKCLDIKPEELE